MEGAVAEQAQSTCICGDVAADVAGAFGAEVKWENVVVLLEIVVRHLQYDTGIRNQNTRHIVERAYLVHLRHVDDNLVEHGYRTAHQARVPALRHDGQTVLVAVLEDLRD